MYMCTSVRLCVAGLTFEVADVLGVQLCRVQSEVCGGRVELSIDGAHVGLHSVEESRRQAVLHHLTPPQQTAAAAAW